MLKLFVFSISIMFYLFNSFSWWGVFSSLMLIVFIMSSMNVNFFYMSDVSYFFGLDVISWGLILLTFWIVALMLASSNKVWFYRYYSSFYMVNIIFMLFTLVSVFISLSFFMFYIFFECSLLPILFLILGWGYQVERVQAGIYLIFYTLFVSLPLFMVIMYLSSQGGMLMFYSMVEESSVVVYFVMMVTFLVKVPMYFVHLWLPKAHVEAPVAGSMILAGVMLKLGGYGLLRLLKIFYVSGLKFNLIWGVISMIGGIYLSLNCLVQIDLKILIAYSSVVHMGIMVLGMITYSKWGFFGSYMLMLGHGLCSSGLFCLANIGYERLGSRSLVINKGLINYFPSLSLWWFLLVSSNMAAPPSMNLLGEISLFNSIIGWSASFMGCLMLLSFFSACYSLYLYLFSQHGEMNMLFMNFSFINMREFLVLCLHWLPLNMLILKIDDFFVWI
uniref:NADH dehydrogenase subunit 4 n=1 Tax=Chimarra paramonorum TaxID=2484723 RepID=UPI0022DCE2ED|nr:NADH dehydrogenase subunit 4 [Chimarra paramonorum]UZZ43852.1 NADH dehydrogenase subunit 4 [Chimarra paramonorum]